VSGLGNAPLGDSPLGLGSSNVATNEYGTFATGNVIFPVNPAITNSALQDIDPVIFYLLDFCSGILNIHLGSRWTAECTRAGRTDLAPSIVAMKVPYNPIPYLQDTAFNFPLLALYRAGRGKISERTRFRHRLETRLELLFIMPPITASEAEILTPFQSAVTDVIVDRNEQGWDPAYASGQKAGILAGFDFLRSEDFDYVNIPGPKTNLFMPTVLIGFTVAETKMPVTGEFEPYTGSDVQSDLATTSTNMNALINAETNLLL
jgi:hypothetical protein